MKLITSDARKVKLTRLERDLLRVSEEKSQIQESVCRLEKRNELLKRKRNDLEAKLFKIEGNDNETFRRDHFSMRILRAVRIRTRKSFQMQIMRCSKTRFNCLTRSIFQLFESNPVVFMIYRYLSVLVK